MDETIRTRAKIARIALESEKSQPLEALYHMACAVRKWSRVREADRKKHGRPSFSEKEWEQLVGLLQTGLSLHDHAPAEADGKTCEICTFEGRVNELDGGYTVLRSCGHWFHAECIAVHLMEVNEQCPTEQWSRPCELTQHN